MDDCTPQPSLRSDIGAKVILLVPASAANTPAGNYCETAVIIVAASAFCICFFILSHLYPTSIF